MVNYACAFSQSELGIYFIDPCPQCAGFPSMLNQFLNMNYTSSISVQIFSLTNLFHKDHNPRLNHFILVKAKFVQFVPVELTLPVYDPTHCLNTFKLFYFKGKLNSGLYFSKISDGVTNRVTFRNIPHRIKFKQLAINCFMQLFSL